MVESPRPERIVLVGFMGSGKTTVGAAVASLLRWGFRDMDRQIEARHGCTVAELFRDRGEAFFREEERDVARETVSLREHVLATGGGAFAVPETRELLRNGAVTVWLQCDLATALGRIPKDGSRPLATNHETMTQLLAERESSYRQADLAVDASKAAPEEVARRVVDAVFTGQFQWRAEDDRKR